MVDQTETLARLNKEKGYEDHLAEHISEYFISSLDSISELTDYERKKIKDYLETIEAESRKHSYLFNQLVQIVIENGENNY
jgi:hypothetical protein